MAVVTVVGGQWGDEGKGRIIDLLAAKARVVVRFQGGSNAGHTVINHLGTFRLHLVPAGIFTPGAICVIGNGVVVDPCVLLSEIAELNANGIDTSNLKISDRAHVVMPYHVILDRLEEQARGDARIGTTGRGIGPAYVDKVSRMGIRFCDLIEPAQLRKKIDTNLAIKNRLFTQVYGATEIDADALFNEYLDFGKRLACYVTDTASIIHEAIDRGDNVVLEGGQGTLLDIDYGTYPFVTSSTTTAAGACPGAGIGPLALTKAVGIFKAYLTRVGSGPFPTEMLDARGVALRERGGEYGATTGRPRRCGWFDAVLARYSTRLNGFNSAAITKLDILDAEPSIQICTGYRLDGKVIDTVPASLEAFSRCEPIYEEVPGWLESTAHARQAIDLPEKARQYIERLGDLIGCRVELISIGPSREQVIVLHNVID